MSEATEWAFEARLWNRDLHFDRAEMQATTRQSPFTPRNLGCKLLSLIRMGGHTSKWAVLETLQ